MERRAFTLLTGGIAIERALRLARPSISDAPSNADFQIRIAPVSVELAPGRTIRTAAYNPLRKAVRAA